MGNIKATGQFTIIDLTDQRTAQFYLQSSDSKIQVYNTGGGSYSPNYSGSSPLIITPVFFFGGDDCSSKIKPANISYKINGENISSETDGAEIDGINLKITKNIGEFGSGDTLLIIATLTSTKENPIIDEQTGFTLTSPLEASVELVKISSGQGATFAVVESSSGRIAFTDDDQADIIITAKLYENGSVKTLNNDNYSWNAIPSQIGGQEFSRTGSELTITRDMVLGARSFICEITNSDGQVYADTIILSDISDPLYCVIESTMGNVFTNHNISTQLTCRVFKGSAEADSEGELYVYEWYKREPLSDDLTELSGKEGKHLEIDDEDVNSKAIFSCLVKDQTRKKTYAYNEITILDIIDNATYIYYADGDPTPSGANPLIKMVPIDGTFVATHIGIYSGNALASQPDPNSSDFNNIKGDIKWSKYIGENGAGLELLYCASADIPEKPPSSTVHWQTTIPTSVEAGQDIYMSQKLSSENEWSDPVRISGSVGPQGVSLITKYKNDISKPSKPADNDLEPQGWDDSITDPEEGERIYMIQRLSNEISWSVPFPISGIDGEANVSINRDGNWVINGTPTGVSAIGKDGADIEFVYYLIGEDKIPPSAAPTRDKNTNVLSDGWSESPSGVSEKHPYEYVSVRIKPAGEDWGLFSNPVIWSSWGVAGRDGDGVEYVFHLTTESDVNKIPAWSEDSEDWKDEPQGVTSEKQYEYVIQIKTTTTEDGKPDEKVSLPKLWAKFGADGQQGPQGPQGNSLTVLYQNSTRQPEAPTAQSLGEWKPSITAPDVGYRTYMTQKLSNEGDWSTPIPITGADGVTPTIAIKNGEWVINDKGTGISAIGRDGKDIKYFYCLGNSTVPKALPYYAKDTGELLDTTSWKESPTGISGADENKKYEYVFVIQKAAGEAEWTDLSEKPVVWSKWGEKGQDGDGVEYKYCRTNGLVPEYPAPEGATYDWKDDPLGVTNSAKYEYVVQLKTTDDPNKVYKVALWAKFGADGQQGPQGIQGPEGPQGAPAKGVVITGDQVFKKVGDSYSPLNLTLTANTYGGVKTKEWLYKNPGMNDWETKQEVINSNELTISPNEVYKNVFGNYDVAQIKITTDDPNCYDIFSVYKISDGEQGPQGNDGASPYYILLTNENITFAADPEGFISPTTVTSNIVAYEGTTKIQPTLDSDFDYNPYPYMTITESYSNQELQLTISITEGEAPGEGATLGVGREGRGVIEIPIETPIQTTLLLTWSKVSTGAQGAIGATGATGPAGSIPTEQPTSPTNGDLWLNGNILNVYIDDTWVATNAQNGCNFYTDQPTSYQEGDLWYLKEDIDIYMTGMILRAINTMKQSFDIADWTDSGIVDVEQQENIKQFFGFDKASGLKIGQTDNKFYVQLSATNMTFYDNSQGNNRKAIVISDNGTLLNDMKGDDAEFTGSIKIEKQLQLGPNNNFVWMTEADGSLTLSIG